MGVPGLGLFEAILHFTGYWHIHGETSDSLLKTEGESGAYKASRDIELAQNDIWMYESKRNSHGEQCEARTNMR